MMDKDFRKASHVKKNKTNQADKVCYFEKKIFIFKKSNYILYLLHYIHILMEIIYFWTVFSILFLINGPPLLVEYNHYIFLCLNPCVEK